MEIVIGLGGNLGNQPAVFRAARDGLAAVGRVLGSSGLYRTRPVGPPQPEYANAALLLATDAPPLAVLDRCQELEAAAGRDRSSEQRWGPRVLDLDLLIAHGPVHRGPRLEVPHRRLGERAFALVPAAELAPDWIHPFLGATLTDLARSTVGREPDAVRRLGAW